jgi:ketosteroid isomerase-like protein
MKYIFLSLLFVPWYLAGAQDQDNNLQAMLGAEHAFMTMAREKNTRDAFLFFLDDNAITFGGGALQKGKKVWEERKPDEAWLYWEPTFSDIAACGDWGFNVGPWEYRPGRGDEKAIAFGHFVTIWKRQSDGQWKAAVDIGISHPQPLEKQPLKSSVFKSEKVQSSPSGNENEILELDRKFTQSLALKNFYGNMLSTEAWLLRPGTFPYHSPDAIRKFLSESPPEVTYHLADADVAPSGDMGCTYGTVTIQSMKDGKPSTQQAGYLRIWKKEDGKNWKLVLDIIS